MTKKNNKVEFIQLTVQENGPEDFRAFVYYKASRVTGTHELRGYGSSVLAACDDAMSRFSELESELENVENEKTNPERN